MQINNTISIGFHDKFVQRFMKTAEDVRSVMKLQAAVEAWQELKADQFVSVPVLEKNAEGTKTRTLSVMNLFHFAAFFLDNMSDEKPTVHDVLAAVTSEQIAGKPPSMLCLIFVGYNYNSPLCIMEQERITFRKMCTSLAMPRSHCIFLSSEKKLVRLVTRASLVRFIAGMPTFCTCRSHHYLENIEHWEDYLKHTVSDSGIGTSGTFLTNDATLEEAFRAITEKTEGAIGITSDTGVLTGFVSIRSLADASDIGDRILENLKVSVDKFHAMCPIYADVDSISVQYVPPS